MHQKFEQVTSMKEIINFLISKKPRGVLSKLKDIIGQDQVEDIIENFQGEILYIPSKTSLSRASLVLEILKIKRFEKEDIPEFNFRIRELGKIYDIKKGRILKIMKTETYVSEGN